MISTAAALVLFLLGVQASHDAAPEWPAGRSWAFSVDTSKLPDNVLEANRPACCVYAKNADGTILRANKVVFLLKR